MREADEDEDEEGCTLTEFPPKLGSAWSGGRGEWRLEVAEQLCRLLRLDTALNLDDEAQAEAFADCKEELYRLSERGSMSEREIPKRLVVREVECAQCDEVSNVELISSVTEEEISIQGKLYHRLTWLCPCCYKEYKTQTIESRLLEMLDERFSAIPAQALECATCKRVKMHHCAQQCSCGAQAFKPRLSNTELRSFMDTLEEIARRAGMDLLSQSVELCAKLFQW